MCEFIVGNFIMPGWGCCICKSYNGLQRTECKNCRQPRHEIKIPEDVKQCPNCGFGAEDMEFDRMSHCPVCKSVINVKQDRRDRTGYERNKK